MSKTIWKPGTVLYPVPAVMVSCGTFEKPNIITIAWCGTLCTSPAMTYISVRSERFSYDIIKQHKEFVINLTTEALAEATDFCGVKSGRDIDKFKETRLTAAKSNEVSAPSIAESPVNIECRVKQIIETGGTHDIFIAEVVSVSVDDKYFDENGKFHFDKTKPICYSHGEYFGLGKSVGSFGYSVRKKKKSGKPGKSVNKANKKRKV